MHLTQRSRFSIIQIKMGADADACDNLNNLEHLGPFSIAYIPVCGNIQ